MNEHNKQMVEEWREYPWYPAISNAANSLVELCPKIVFDQIKEKFGGLRFYYTIPLDLDPSDMPKYVQGSRERLEQQAEEIVRYAEGWCAGYDAAKKETAGG